MSNVARALRRDTQAIVANTRQLVSAVSGLTTAVNALAAVVRSFNGSGPSTQLPAKEEGGETVSGHQLNLRKRKAPNKKLVLRKKRK